jgi:hypothetical protein
MVSLRTWRAAGDDPTAGDHHREDEFLEQHLNGGALVHSTTARVLAAALAQEENDNEKARLALRIFAEYVNALETLGAWGWAIRNRRSSRLLLDAFLSYAPGDVKDFYRTVASHTGELSSLLRLPPTQTIIDAFRKGGAPLGGLLGDFSRVETNLSQAAQHYFHPDELFVTNYNKAKHGAPIIRDDQLKPGEFYVLAPGPTAAHRYMLSKFSSSDEMIEHTLKLIEMVSNTTRALVSFARNLKSTGLLY